MPRSKSRSLGGFLLSIACFFVSVESAIAAPSGEAVYQRRCAGCHEQTNPRIPPRSALQQMPASRILSTLDFGAMMTVAYPLSRDERQAVADYLGTPAPAISYPESA